MNCKRCGKPLPNRSVTCRFCGMLMDQEQIDFQKKMNENNKNYERLELLSEKYGRENDVEYRKPKENKALGLAIIIIILFSENHKIITSVFIHNQGFL